MIIRIVIELVDGVYYVRQEGGTMHGAPKTGRKFNNKAEAFREVQRLLPQEEAETKRGDKNE